MQNALVNFDPRHELFQVLCDLARDDEHRDALLNVAGEALRFQDTYSQHRLREILRKAYDDSGILAEYENPLAEFEPGVAIL